MMFVVPANRLAAAKVLDRANVGKAMVAAEIAVGVAANFSQQGPMLKVARSLGVGLKSLQAKTSPGQVCVAEHHVSSGRLGRDKRRRLATPVSSECVHSLSYGFREPLL